MIMRQERVHEAVCALLRQVSKDIVLPHYRKLKSSQIEEKSPGDLVTIADRLSEEALSLALSKIIPDAKIVGEEACAADPSLMRHLSADQCWIIDPIDGTGNYARGDGAFGIIIALTRQNETIAGWMYDPIKKRLCHTFKGQGAFINNIRIATPLAPSNLPIAALATGFMNDEQRAKTMAQAGGNYEIVPIPMCAAEQYPLLATGDHNISIFERILPWDHAAGILFLNEAGGKAARWDSSEYRPADTKKGLLGASSPTLWEQAAKIFNS